jgi:hypothetical protein
LGSISRSLFVERKVMSSAEEVISKQQRLVKAALALEEKKNDPKALLEAAAKVAEMGKELEKSAKRLEAEFAGTAGPEERVVLLPDQRQRLAEVTGVAMDMLVVTDRDGAFARAMPTTDRATIERMAARQAAEIAIKKAKQGAIDNLVKELEKLGVPELEPVIAAIKADPTLKLLVKQQEEAAAELKARTEGAGQP